MSVHPRLRVCGIGFSSGALRVYSLSGPTLLLDSKIHQAAIEGVWYLRDCLSQTAQKQRRWEELLRRQLSLQQRESAQEAVGADSEVQLEQKKIRNQMRDLKIQSYSPSAPAEDDDLILVALDASGSEFSLCINERLSLLLSTRETALHFALNGGRQGFGRFAGVSFHSCGCEYALLRMWTGFPSVSTVSVPASKALTFSPCGRYCLRLLNSKTICLFQTRPLFLVKKIQLPPPPRMRVPVANASLRPPARGERSVVGFGFAFDGSGIFIADSFGDLQLFKLQRNVRPARSRAAAEGVRKPAKRRCIPRPSAWRASAGSLSSRAGVAERRRRVRRQTLPGMGFRRRRRCTSRGLHDGFGQTHKSLARRAPAPNPFCNKCNNERLSRFA